MNTRMKYVFSFVESQDNTECEKITFIEFIREYSAMWWRVKITLKSTVNMVKDKYEIYR